MAFTEKELEISNKSYTHKDFEAVYTELLTFAENLSKRYSPRGSNESDPFVVLLKLAAFVTDKVNYNLDKNILERFILSCTQESSMQDITSRLGYHMHYYIASATDVIFRYVFDDNLDFDSVYIPRFSILSDGGSIQYVTTLPTVIDKISNESVPVKALQGKIKTLEVFGESIIKLENLNSNNILYFPESRVAENGVFINIDKGEEWQSSNNLHSEIYGSKVYKFGFDSIRNLPYLEFPEWIASIIDDGLTIQYLVTDGEQGNISARALKTITRNISDEADDVAIGVYNLSAADTGKDPETIDESYHGFKKVIGTFDTLVTCRDYANKIYQLIDSLTDDPLVSNVQVGDRRNDINYSCDVITLGEDLAPKIESIPVQVTPQGASDPVDGLSPFGIEIYPLQPYSAVKKNGYEDSYRLLENIEPIKDGIEENKTICHELYNLGSRSPSINEDGAIGAIEIEYKLTVIINTIKKVNSIEQQDILANVNKALESAYNPRNLEFGYEIAYEELLNVIQSADERIKFAVVQEPEQTPTVMTRATSLAGDPGIPLQNDTESSDQFKFIVAKNIFAGRISAFSYDDAFQYSFLQQNPTKYKEVKYILSECNIPAFPYTSSEEVEQTTTSYTLKSNEVIQFLSPKQITKISYPYGICYCLHLTSRNYIPANSQYKLKDGEEFIITYEDNNSNTIITPYAYSEDNNISICPNFDLYDTNYMATNISPHVNPTFEGISNEQYHYDPQNYKFYTLSTKQQVDIKSPISDELTKLSKCYWTIDFDRTNWKPAGNNTYELILDDGDYFFYSDINLTSLFAYGTGTVLKASGASASYITNIISKNNELPEVNLDEINLQGLKALKPIFVDMLFNNDQKLIISESNITTVVENDEITVTAKKLSSGEWQIKNNEFELIPNNSADPDSPEITKIKIKYADETEETELNLSNNVNIQWKARALLDIDAGPRQPQVLVGNQAVYVLDPLDPDPEHKTLIAESSDSNPATNQDTLLFDILVQKGGAQIINLEYTSLNQEKVCPSILTYRTATSVNGVQPITQISNDFYRINLTETDVGSRIYESQTLNCAPVAEVNGSSTSWASMDRYITLHVTGLPLYTPSTPPDPPAVPEVIVYIDGLLNGSSQTEIIVNATTSEWYSDRLHILNDGFVIIKLSLPDDPSVQPITTFTVGVDLTNSTQDISSIDISIADLKNVIDINPLLNVKFSGSDNLLRYLRDSFPEQFNHFYLTNNPENSRKIQLSEKYKLDSAQMFYDQNNIANKWTIPKIDFKNSDISIAYSSKL